LNLIIINNKFTANAICKGCGSIGILILSLSFVFYTESRDSG
tara:strand:- start:180 stop:305 length:126 start_codon:yes stop_codon:yes gene_type:complete